MLWILRYTTPGRLTCPTIDMPAALDLVPEAARVTVQPLARQAFVDGFTAVLWVAGLLGLLGALVVGSLMRKPIPTHS